MYIVPYSPSWGEGVIFSINLGRYSCCRVGKRRKEEEKGERRKREEIRKKEEKGRKRKKKG